MIITAENDMLFDKYDIKDYLDKHGIDFIEAQEMFYEDEHKQIQELSMQCQEWERESDGYYCHLRNLCEVVQEVINGLTDGSRTHKKTFAAKLQQAIDFYGV